MSHRQHGTYVKYVQDRCRCEECKAANRAYTNARNANPIPPYVDAGEARRWVGYLTSQGVGLKTISIASGVSCGVLSKLLYGSPLANGKRRPPSRRIRRATADRLLAVTPRATAAGAKIDAGATWELINSMLAAGVTRAAIARALGATSDGLQLGRRLISARNARRVAELHSDWQAGRVVLTARGNRHNPGAVVRPARQPSSVEEAKARYDDRQRLYEQLAEIVEVRNARTWRSSAACRGRDTNLWFPARGDQETRQAAIKICQACIVRAQCAEELDRQVTPVRVDGIYAARSRSDRRGDEAA